MSTLTSTNLFSGGAGLYGPISDGFTPGISLEVFGNGSIAEVNVQNPDGAQMQIECITEGSNIWQPVGEIISATQSYFTQWSEGFIYRIRLLQASVTGVIVTVANNRPSAPAASISSNGGFLTPNYSYITIDRIATLPPLP